MAIANIVNSPMIIYALLWLLEFRDPDNNIVLRAVNNLEDVTSRGNLYTAFPFDLTLPPDDGQRPQSIQLQFANVGQELMELVRAYAPGNNPTVKLELVVSDKPDIVEKTVDFMELANVTYDALTITFELASSSIFARKTITATYNQIEFPGLFWGLR